MSGMKCFNCGKGRMVGRQHKHHPGVAGKRWRKRAPKTQKIFKPNLHSARIVVDGTPKRIRLCTKCLRLLKGTSKKHQNQITQSAKSDQPIVAVA